MLETEDSGYRFDNNHVFHANLIPLRTIWLFGEKSIEYEGPKDSPLNPEKFLKNAGGS